uniref:DDE-1 domain-containing protein n=1 Tax=Trichuris muris TaxID=70415 RepID=A0A5S6QBV7_TRIMR
MKRQKDAILSYAKKTEEADCSDSKIMRTSRFEEMDEALYVWFLRNRTVGNPKRHGIRCHTINGEKLSTEEGSAEDLREELRKYLDEGGYDFAYNADETGLNWKALPTQSLVERSEENAPGYKSRKERVTIMLCANSTGEKIGKTGKVHLLIDNAPAHPVIDLLNSVDQLVTVKFFPPNVISWIQSMDQDVIRSFKSLYRKNLLRELLMKYDNTAESVTAFYKRISLKDCCYMAAASWESVKQTTLKNSWNRVLGKSASGWTAVETMAWRWRKSPGC